MRVYDCIREGKFKTPERIKQVESLLRKKDFVVAWWCRQSGKSTLAVKVARDFALANPNSKVGIFSVNSASSSNISENVFRTIDKREIQKSSRKDISLKNGSHIYFSSINSSLCDRLDLVVYDEFEYFFPRENFFNSIKTYTVSTRKTLIDKLKEMFSFRKKKDEKKTKFLFISSLKDEKNFEELKSVLRDKNLSIHRVSWKKAEIKPEKIEELKRILGEEMYKKEYDSYE